ncbi:unnamed protein product [Callosobruchus maculatus]|uniref:Uncharacterized protein n=1 Tax=Callosobruchus maculatus TaxID=64391 RepID=A0A653BGG8_CALMS|nr:unnamed protein product [Callosobruchus maculatus]
MAIVFTLYIANCRPFFDFTNKNFRVERSTNPSHRYLV